MRFAVHLLVAADGEVDDKKTWKGADPSETEFEVRLGTCRDGRSCKVPTHRTFFTLHVASSKVDSLATRRAAALPGSPLTYSPFRSSPANSHSFKRKILRMSIVSTPSNKANALPPEVLITIFELATYNTTREIDHLADLPPFEGIYSEKRDARDRDALRTKRSLSLTCSSFRRIIEKLLYEDIWIRHGSARLLGTFRSSEAAPGSGFGLGRYVRRATLAPTEFNFAAADTPEILKLCPNLRIISRASCLNNSNCGPALDDLSPLRVHRVDWTDVLAGRDFTLNLSPHFVWHSPTVRVLTLDTDNLLIPESEGNSGQNHEIIINLPNLHTLRLHSCDALGDPEEFWYSVQLPSLRRLIIERPLALYALHSGCLVFYGPRIKTLELGRYRRFLRIDAISIALGYCPNVETLLFPVSTTMPPAKNALDSPREEWMEYCVKHIGLNASVEEGLDDQVRRTWLNVQLEDLVDALFGEGTRFTALERITLYGREWRDIVCDEAFEPIAKAMHSSRVIIDCEDDVAGQVVQKMLDC